MERKIFLGLLIQCGIFLQAFGSISETNTTASWDRHVLKKRIIDTSPNRNESFLYQDVRYVVPLVEKNGQVFCTGSILTPHIIITAAHCVIDSTFFIESGGRRSRSATIHHVLSKLVHEKFDKRSQKNDVALVVIKEPIDVIHSYHRAIKLYEGHLPVNSFGLVSGWGCMKRNPAQFPTQACSINVAIISWQECQHAYRPRNTFTSHEICTYYTSRTKCCWFGDSGGPLVVDGHLVGVFSWFRVNGEAGFPDVFMNLLHPDYKSWIAKWTKHFLEYPPH